MRVISGVRIRYCGHDAAFIADVYHFGEVVTIHTSPIDLATISRPAGDVDFHLFDFPSEGCWKPNIGIFSVPANQLKAVR